MGLKSLSSAASSSAVKPNTSVIAQASAELNHQLQLALNQQRPVLFLASGGSALKLLDNLEDQMIRRHATNLTLGVLDERYSEDPQINNFCQLMKTRLYQTAVEAGAIAIDTRIHSNESATDLAHRWETTLKTWRQSHSTGQIIITQGIGPDGHTAGMMPFPENAQFFTELFNQPDKWVTSYDAGQKNPYPLRITTTTVFLLQVDASICVATGSEKKAALELLMADEGNLATTPARILRELPAAWLFTDQLPKTCYTFSHTTNLKL